VIDQETDDYDVLAALHTAVLRRVIRADPMSQTTDAELGVKEALVHQLGTVFGTVPLNPRSAQKAVNTRGPHPGRVERLGTLHVRRPVEEYFKAHETGCASERRQLTNVGGLVRAFAVIVPLDRRLLLLLLLGRLAVPIPVDHLFDAEQVLLLCNMLKSADQEPPGRPTMREARSASPGSTGISMTTIPSAGSSSLAASSDSSNRRQGGDSRASRCDQS
jgi:hypothetical protein